MGDTGEEWTAADRVEETTPSIFEGPFTNEEVRNAINEQRHSQGADLLDRGQGFSISIKGGRSNLGESGVAKELETNCLGEGAGIVTVLSYETRFDSGLELQTSPEAIAEDVVEDISTTEEKRSIAMSEGYEELVVTVDVGDDSRVYVEQVYCGPGVDSIEVE